jgi:hypothetical protein
LLVQTREFIVDEIVAGIDRVLPLGDVELHRVSSPALGYAYSYFNPSYRQS